MNDLSVSLFQMIANARKLKSDCIREASVSFALNTEYI